MSKFNLRFRGEILPEKDAAQVKTRFGKLFGIEDPERLERFFSGETIVLRRNLDRKTAAEYYAKLRKLGVESELVKLESDEPPPSGKEARGGTPPRQTARQRKAARKEAEKARRKRQAEEAARRRQAEEEAARQQAEEEARRRQAEEEAALRRAEEEQERQRKAAEEAARREAQERAQRQREAEEQARIRAEEQRRRAEEEARQRAGREAAERRAAEEAARRRAKEEALRRREAEEQRRRAEEEARQRAEREAARRKAAEEAARRRAEEEALRRREAEERARLREEQKRQKEQEAARRRAEREAAKRRAAEAAAREKAEEARRQREAAEAAARQRTLQEERRRAADAEAARRREAQRQREAEARARREAERQAAASQRREEQRRARQEAKQRAEAEAAARLEERQKAEREAARVRAEKEAMEAQAIARGAAALSRPGGIGAGRDDVRTALPLPSRRPAGDAPPPRRRQPGEPNFYALEPFRNTAEVKGRAARSRQRMARAFTVAVAALALALIVAGRYLSLSPPPPVTGPEAMAVNPGGGPLLLAGGHLLLHDRSGTGSGDRETAALGLDGLAPPLAFARRDLLLATGRLRDSGDGAGAPLLRCDLAEAACAPFSPETSDYRADAIAVHPITGAVFVADASAGELLKFDGEGRLLARAAAPVPAAPAIRLDAGLLYMNSAEGPAIAVFRYEDEAFGRQLDEILLLPPTGMDVARSRVGNFIRAGDSWWARLYDPEDGSGGLFRFDADWGFAAEVPLPRGMQAGQLAEWNGRLLVADPGHLEIQRFAPSGAAEAPLASELLAALAGERQRAARLSRIAWRGALAASALVAVAALVAGLLLRLQSMVYRSSRERGAEPADELLERIQWVDPVAGRDAMLRRRAHLYLVGATVTLGLLAALTVDPIWLTALLLALAGPAIALDLLRRHPVGHIGVDGEQLLLADHRNVYHLGGGSRIHHRGAFLLIDDVVVFTGSGLLPAFDPGQVRERVAPLAAAGVRVDRATVAVKLLQGRHPIATGTLAMLACTAAAITLLTLRFL